MTTLDQVPHQELYLGMEVRVTQAAVGNHYRLNTNRQITLNQEDRLRITAIYSTSVTVRTIGTKYNTYSGRREEMSFSFYVSHLELSGESAEPPRKLGKKPDDTEEMTYIGIDDPGIQWLWDDMGTYATQQGYCPQYDALAIKLGIPGRPRDFSVAQVIGGIPITATVKARSQREANELVQAALAANVPDQTNE